MTDTPHRGGIFYRWFACPVPGSPLICHRLATGSLLVHRDNSRTPALCGDARSHWRALEDFDQPEVFTKCPTCQTHP